jgi:hypothetical protein
MDGGGNDVLLCDGIRFPGCADCKNNANAANIPVCQQVVQAALDRAVTLMGRAAAVGVKDAVYFFYPHVPDGTLIGGARPNAILDYALPRARDLCNSTLSRTNGQMRCTFVDMIPTFTGHPEYFAAGDIHPNTLGSAAMARTIWSSMKSACVSQKAASGCCG